jgi:hypothetical protein
MDQAIYRNIQVEILDTYKAGNTKYVAVRAVEGKPFVGGNKWPTRTEYTTAEFDELYGITLNPQTEPAQPTLLSLALAYQDKSQWHSGESVWIWGDKHRGAFLKAEQGFVNLCLVGYRKSVTIFWLNPKTWKWEITRNAGINYHQWVSGIMECAK